MTYLYRVSLDFLRHVEAAVVELNGGRPVTIAQAARIATARTALEQAARVGRILAAAGEPGTVAIATATEPGGASAKGQTGLTHEQWLAYSDRLIRYREAADRAIVALGLDSKAERPDPWDAIYCTPTAPPSAPAGPPSPPDVAGQESGHLAASDAPAGHGASANGIPQEGATDGA